jgi:outer membrane protein
MKSYDRSFLLLSLILASFYPASAHQSPADTLQNTPLTLTQVWERAANFSKAVQMKQLHLEGSVEQVKDAKFERLPDVNIDGEYARITNMPIYENGLFKAPQQFEVLHQTYTAGADAYLNLYNGNKTNIEINARKTENNIAVEQKN